MLRHQRCGPGSKSMPRHSPPFLEQNVAGFAGPLTIRQFKGGQSNPTYLLSTPARRYVLRRKPPGQLLASAHAVDREYKVITALGRHTDVPVPGTYVLCTDDAVIGTWFYVMEHVEGRIFWDPSFPDVAPERVVPIHSRCATRWRGCIACAPRRPASRTTARPRGT